MIDAPRDTNSFIDNLVDGMEQMLDNQERAKAAKIAAKLGDKYDMAELVEIYASLYKTLILEKQPCLLVDV